MKNCWDQMSNEMGSNLHFWSFESNEMEIKSVSNEIIVMGRISMLIVSLLSCFSLLQLLLAAFSPPPGIGAYEPNFGSNLCFLALGSSVFVASMRFILACCASFAAVNVFILLAPLLRLRCLLPNLFTALYHCCLSGCNFGLCSSCN